MTSISTFKKMFLKDFLFQELRQFYHLLTFVISRFRCLVSNQLYLIQIVKVRRNLDKRQNDNSRLLSRNPPTSFYVTIGHRHHTTSISVLDQNLMKMTFGSMTGSQIASSACPTFDVSSFSTSWTICIPMCLDPKPRVQQPQVISCISKTTELASIQDVHAMSQLLSISSLDNRSQLIYKCSKQKMPCQNYKSLSTSYIMLTKAYAKWHKLHLEI